MQEVQASLWAVAVGKLEEERLGLFLRSPWLSEDQGQTRTQRVPPANPPALHSLVLPILILGEQSISAQHPSDRVRHRETAEARETDEARRVTRHGRNP